MIALPQRLPFVIWRNSRLVPLSEPWLTESIQASAHHAGLAQWELAPHIAKAIAVYLEEEFNRNTITLAQLEEMMARSIERVGFQDVAAHSNLIAPRVSISLFELARRSPLELLFFPYLRDKIEDAMGYEARGLIFEGLRPCVKKLYESQRWCQNYEDLRGRIIDFIRASLPHREGSNLSLVIT
jgi:hypothetical protein